MSIANGTASPRATDGSVSLTMATHADLTLVIGPSWIGDAVMSQSLLKALKLANSKQPIDVLAPVSVRPVFSRMKEVRNALISPFGHGEFAIRHRLALGAELRGQYTDAYVLPGSWKSAVVPWAAKVPKRCGYRREWRYGLVNDMRPVPGERKRETAIMFQALADLSVLTDRGKLLEPCLDVDTANRERLLERWGLKGKQFAVIVPGAEFGEAKRWPTRHWVHLARELSRHEIKPALLGSKADRTITATIASEHSNAIDLAGETTLEDAIDLISSCSAAVTNDLGLMHVAAAVGSPVVAVFGSTSPKHTPPLSPQARVVTLDLPCSPCWSRKCPLGHHDCLQNLEVERVIAELRILGVL